uniref:Uncharacterized protein n=1 Tax=Trichuris muris TaxID=70415 RepID=A0A5S6QUV2_TRIMR
MNSAVLSLSLAAILLIIFSELSISALPESLWTDSPGRRKMLTFEENAKVASNFKSKRSLFMSVYDDLRYVIRPKNEAKPEVQVHIFQ